MPKRVVVVGGGIAGLCTAAALVKRGIEPTLLERRRIAGSHGSSHGPSRITRSVYADSVYVRLMQRIHAEHWPAMEQRLGRKLLFKTDGLFFGHGALWEKYLDAVLSQGVAVEHLDVGEGRRRFPQFRLESATSVLHDHTAAVVAAERVLSGLRDWLDEHGAEIREDTRLLQLEPRSNSVSLMTSAGRFDADAVVLTVGSWIGELIPQFARAATVLRQTIGYYDLGDREASQPPNFPVWVAIGNDEEDVFYGLPEFDRTGVKVGRHRTIGANDDADVEDDPAASLADLDAFVEREFALKPRSRLSVERCLYTVAPHEDFVLGLHPEEPRIVLGSACSGHGFKFGPWTGEVLADFALEGDCGDVDYTANRERFSPEKLWSRSPEAAP
jgi:sarcosine oxidase